MSSALVGVLNKSTHHHCAWISLHKQSSKSAADILNVASPQETLWRIYSKRYCDNKIPTYSIIGVIVEKLRITINHLQTHLQRYMNSFREHCFFLKSPKITSPDEKPHTYQEQKQKSRCLKAANDVRNDLEASASPWTQRSSCQFPLSESASLIISRTQSVGWQLTSRACNFCNNSTFSFFSSS